MGVTDEELAAKREEVEALRAEIADRVSAREEKAREAENQIAYDRLNEEHKRLENQLAAMDQDEALLTEGMKPVEKPADESGAGDRPPSTTPPPTSSGPAASVNAGTTPVTPQGDDKPKEK